MVALVALNATFLLFFVLYDEADEWAVDRSELHGGFDSSMLLPHDVLLWVAAHAALGLLIALDVLGVLLARRLRSIAKTQPTRP